VKNGLTNIGVMTQLGEVMFAAYVVVLAKNGFMGYTLACVDVRICVVMGLWILTLIFCPPNTVLAGL
jgi:hypothetical protein